MHFHGKHHLVDAILRHYSYLKAQRITPGDLYGAGCIGLLMGIAKLEKGPNFDKRLKAIIRSEMQDDIRIMTMTLTMTLTKTLTIKERVPLQ